MISPICASPAPARQEKRPLSDRYFPIHCISPGCVMHSMYIIYIFECAINMHTL
jgi:hypothetical protein